MSITIDDGGPAFPLQSGFGADGTWVVNANGGMSLRDYFAAQAPQDAIENLIGDSRASAADFLGITFEAYSSALHYVPAVAKARYAYADAMIAERAKAGAK